MRDTARRCDAVIASLGPPYSWIRPRKMLLLHGVEYLHNNLRSGVVIGVELEEAIIDRGECDPKVGNRHRN